MFTFYNKGPDITVDERWFMMYLVYSMDIPSSVVYFYPRLFPITRLAPERTELPKAIRCTTAKIDNSEAYILGMNDYHYS